MLLLNNPINSNFNNINYFAIKNINVNIPFYNKETINIISSTCHESIDSFSIDGNFAVLNISLCFKILYTLPNSKSLNILRYNCKTQEFIHLPNKFDGLPLYSLNIKNNLQANCNINTLSFLNFDGFMLYFSLVIFSEVLFKPYLSIIYKISLGSDVYSLYASNSFSDNFVQLNFSPKAYNHICFSSFDNTIFYFINNTVYSYSLLTMTETSLFTDNSLIYFLNISPNKFIIYRSTNDDCSINLYDIYSHKNTLLYKHDRNCNFSSFMYSSDILSFISNTQNGCYLIVLNIYGDILFNDCCDFNKIFVNTSSAFALGFKDSILQVINLKNKSVYSVALLVNDFLLNDLIYLSDNIAIIYGVSNSINYIFSFNLETLCFTELFKSSFNISSMCIDYKGGLLFTSNELGLYNVYNLKIGFKPTLYLKLFAKNLSLLTRI